MSAFETISADDSPFAKASGTASTKPVLAELTATREPDGLDTRITKGVSTAVPEVITHDCDYCGHCETPGECAWSRVCPVCSADPRALCKTPTGGVTGLHSERWAA